MNPEQRNALTEWIIIGIGVAMLGLLSIWFFGCSPSLLTVKPNMVGPLHPTPTLPTSEIPWYYWLITAGASVVSGHILRAADHKWKRSSGVNPYDPPQAD